MAPSVSQILLRPAARKKRDRHASRLLENPVHPSASAHRGPARPIRRLRAESLRSACSNRPATNSVIREIHAMPAIPLISYPHRLVAGHIALGRHGRGRDEFGLRVTSFMAFGRDELGVHSLVRQVKKIAEKAGLVPGFLQQLREKSRTRRYGRVVVYDVMLVGVLAGQDRSGWGSTGPL